jgi:recombination protein RecT
MPNNVTTSTTKQEIDQQQKQRQAESRSLAIIKQYARSEEIQTRFENMLGNQAGKNYIESVIIAVTNNDGLQKCDPKSIMISAMRAASLKLSVDPALHQAHLVAYKNVCTLIPDYHGLVQLTVQTGMYIDPPNVSEVYEGEKVETNRFTGKVVISGEKKSDKIIGWIGYFKDIYGNERFLYMTNEECDAHGKRYNPGGFASEKSAWATDREKMRRKTVLRQLVSRWGYYSPATKQILFEEPEIIDAQVQDLPEPGEPQEQEHIPADESIKQMGF